MLKKSIVPLVLFLLAVPLHADLLTENTTDSLTPWSENIPTDMNGLYTYATYQVGSGFTETDTDGIFYNAGSSTSQPFAYREYTCAPGYKIIGVTVTALLSGGDTKYAMTGVGNHKEIFQVVSSSKTYAWTSVDANIAIVSGWTGMKYYFYIPASDNVDKLQVQFSADTNWEPQLHQIDLVVVPIDSTASAAVNLLTGNTTDSLTPATQSLMNGTNYLYAYTNNQYSSGFEETDNKGLTYNVGSSTSQPFAYREYTCAPGHRFTGVVVTALLSGGDSKYAETGVGNHKEIFQVVSSSKTYAWTSVAANIAIVTGWTGMQYTFVIPESDNVNKLQVQFSADTYWEPQIHQIDFTVGSVINGDANSDGAVDVGDLGILAANYGMTSGATWGLGDFNGDGAVDVGDLGILAANYGQGATGGADFNADYAKVFGTAAEKSNDTSADSVDSVCSGLGLSLIVGLGLMGLMLVKLEE